jgi:hypothetical protein
MPQRIQSSRKKGFNLQRESKKLNGLPATIVSRPSKFGNPFWHNGNIVFVLNILDNKGKWIEVCKGGIKTVLKFYRMLVTGKAKEINNIEFNVGAMRYILPWIERFEKLNVKDLADKNLSCWCDLREECHVDILLDLANK